MYTVCIECVQKHSFRCRELPEHFETELCGKTPTKEKHGEFAKQNLGNTGRKNLNGTPFLSTTLVLLTLTFGQLKRYVCELQKLEQVKCADSN